MSAACECADKTPATAVAVAIDDALPLLPEIEEDPEPYPPWNFSWILDAQLAVMAWPQNVLNLEYLYNVGIRHLVTLSPEKMPPIQGFNKLEWTLIPIDEFEDPSLKQIVQFVDICQKAMNRRQPVGVHCRMGHGRSGVMAACYLVRFNRMTPERAITEVRMVRPNSIETPEQERAVFKYFDYERGTITDINLPSAAELKKSKSPSPALPIAPKQQSPIQASPPPPSPQPPPQA